LPLVKELLHLAGRVYAHEILPEIMKQIGNGFLGMPENNEAKDLFNLTLDIVSGLSRVHGAGDTIRHLVASSYFQPFYAPRAFVALCRAEPKKFIEHLKLLRNAFTVLHSKIGTDDVFITAHRIAQYVNPKIIAANIRNLNLSIRPGIDVLKYDNWLVDALFVNDKTNNYPSPLLLERDFVIVRRSQRQFQKPVKVDLECASDEWDHVDNVRRSLNKILENVNSNMWAEIVKLTKKSSNRSRSASIVRLSKQMKSIRGKVALKAA